MLALPVLRTPRLLLRWFTPDDAGFVRRLLNDPGWIRHIGDRGVRTRGQAAAWITSRLVEAYGRLGFGFWALQTHEGELVGLGGLIKRDTLPHVDVGYALLPPHRGRGYAREAAAACVAYGRDVLGLPEIWGITGPDNPASAHVLRDIGLRDVGLRHLGSDSRPTRVFRSAAFPRGDDRAQVAALSARLLAACRVEPPAIPTVAALPHFFTHDAIVRTEEPAGRVTAVGLHAWIAPRAELAFGPRLRHYAERETAQRTELEGALAHRWQRCERTGELDGRRFRVVDTRSLQLVRTRLGWKVASLAVSEGRPG